MAQARSARSMSDRPARILRFDAVQRTAHWANALLFGILMVTALPLYFGSLADVVGRRHLVAEIHLWTGIALPFPVVLSLVGPMGSRHATRRAAHQPMDEGGDSLAEEPRPQTTELDKFNPGQKLNAIFVAGVIVVMLATGSMLQWFRFFPVSWRTGATFVHDVFAFAIFAVVLGHIALALTHRDSMRSMIKGWVTEGWVARHAAAWLREMRVDAEKPNRQRNPPRSDPMRSR